MGPTACSIGYEDTGATIEFVLGTVHGPMTRLGVC